MIRWRYKDSSGFFNIGEIYGMRQGFAITSSESGDVYVPINTPLEAWINEYQVFHLTNDTTNIDVEMFE